MRFVKKDLLVEGVLTLVLFVLFSGISLGLVDIFWPKDLASQVYQQAPPEEALEQATRLTLLSIKNWTPQNLWQAALYEFRFIKKFLFLGDFYTLFGKSPVVWALVLASLLLFGGWLFGKLEKAKTRKRLERVSRTTLGLSFVLAVLAMSLSPFFMAFFYHYFFPTTRRLPGFDNFFFQLFYPMLINEVVVVLALTTLFSLISFLILNLMIKRKTQ